MTFGGNTRDLGSFGEETNEIVNLHQIHEEILFSERGDGVAGIKRRRHDLSSNGVRDLPIFSLCYLFCNPFSSTTKGDDNPIRTLGDCSKPSHEGYRNTIELPVGNNMVPLRSDTIQLVQNGCSFNRLWSEDPNQHLKDFLKLVDSLDLDGENREERACIYFNFPFVIKLAIGLNAFLHDPSPHGRILLLLRDRNAEESYALLEDLAFYDNESWNDPRDVAKPVKAIALPQDVPSTSDLRLIELENQICSGPHDTQYCMEDPEQSFVEYASSRTDETGGLVSNFMASQDARLSKFEANFKQQQNEMTNKINTVLKAITNRITGALPSDTVKNLKLSTSPVLSACSYPTMDPQCSTHVYGSINSVMIHPKQQNDSYDDRTEENKEEEKVSPENINVDPSTPLDPSISFITEKVLKLNSFFESLGLVPQSSSTELVCTKGDDGDVMFIEIVKKYDNSREEEPKAGEHEVEYFDIFLTRSKLAYHKYLMCGPISLIFLKNLSMWKKLTLTLTPL
ncbi:hypothetical protein Tco_1376025 [Tanacetum coccineum]